MVQDKCPLCGQVVSRNGWGRSRHLAYHERLGHIRRVTPGAGGWRLLSRGLYLAPRMYKGRLPVVNDPLPAFKSSTSGDHD